MRVVEYVRGKLHRYRNQIFRKCLCTCSSVDTLQRHHEMCSQDEGFVITMPKPGKDTHRFKNLTARWYVPRVIYFDLESLLQPVYGPQPDPQKSSTETLENYQACGYALAVFEFGKREVLKFELKRGENVMKELIASLKLLAKQIYLGKRKYYTFTGTPKCTREEAHTCWICETEFADNDQVVLDHCHYTNKFLGWAHNECNINRKTANYIPVIAHNLSNCDLHFIIKALSNKNPETLTQ